MCRLNQRFSGSVDFFVAIFAALIAYGARSLASGLTAGLAFAATDIAALFHGICNDTVDMFHISSEITFYYLYNIIKCGFWQLFLNIN